MAKFKCRVVTIKIPLYAYDENDQPRALTEEETEDAMGFISSQDDVGGYSIYATSVAEEEISVG